MKPIGKQLSFEDMALTAIAGELPAIDTPVFRWRRLVRRLDPLGSKPSRAAFQAVASVLADYADRNGDKCRPTIETIAKESGFGERSVQYAIRELVRWGVVDADRSGGRGYASTYKLICPPKVGAELPALKAVPNEKGAHERVHLRTVHADD